MRKWISMFVHLGILTVLFVPTLVNAQLSSDLDTGLTETGGAAYQVTDVPNIGNYIGERIIAPLFGIIGVIFLVLVIYAAFLWMTAAGNTSQVEKAKNILVSAIIGTVIAFGAYVITFTIFEALAPSA